MRIEDLFEEDTVECENVWILSLLYLILFNNGLKSEPRINVYINGDKVGE